MPDTPLAPGTNEAGAGRNRTPSDSRRIVHLPATPSRLTAGSDASSVAAYVPAICGYRAPPEDDGAALRVGAVEPPGPAPCSGPGTRRMTAARRIAAASRSAG